MRSAPGLCTQPELWTPGHGAVWRPSFGCGFQQESKNTNMGLMPLLAAIVTNWERRR
jgi:hypothetical protein